MLRHGRIVRLRGSALRRFLPGGERVLLPSVRRAAETTLVVADGFSCREQIAQRTDRRALHLSQVLQLAASNVRAPADRVERALVTDHGAETARRLPAYAAIALVGIGAAMALTLGRGSAR
jgi:phosphohistidine phosphatase SixA